MRIRGFIGKIWSVRTPTATDSGTWGSFTRLRHHRKTLQSWEGSFPGWGSRYADSESTDVKNRLLHGVELVMIAIVDGKI